MNILKWILTILLITVMSSIANAQFFGAEAKAEKKEEPAKPAKPAKVKKAKKAKVKKAAPVKAETPEVVAEALPVAEVSNDQAEIKTLLVEIASNVDNTPSLSDQQIVQKENVLKEIEDAKSKIADLKVAIQNGLNPELVEDSKVALHQKILTLQQELKTIVPIASQSELQVAIGNLDAKLDALDAKVDAISKETAVEEKVEDVKKSYGIEITFDLASAYVFRGLNVFQSKNQHDSHAMYAPGISWSIFDTGLALGYWGAYQINGDNEEEMVAVALGHEQDLYLSFDRDLSDKTSFNASMFYYFYPFSNEDQAGCKNPSFIEPSVALSYSNNIDLGLGVAYFAGLQEAVSGLSYLYLNPSIAKSFALGDKLETSIGLGVGYKVFKEGADELSDNQFDINFDLDFAIAATDSFSVAPGVHLAWTNLEDKSVGDEYVIYFSIGSAFGI